MTAVPAAPVPRPLRVAIFGQSLISDWNHGNAHFLRGLVRALQHLGHTVTFYEEAQNWSLANLIREQGSGAVAAFHAAFPGLTSSMYKLGAPTERDAWLRRVLAEADIVLVHEWNDPDLIRAIGGLGQEFPHLTTLFHDTHYRAYSEPETMRALALEHYDAVLAFSPSIAAIYRGDFGLLRVYVVHEAADVDLFRPLERPLEQDVVFIGNWGDQDRNEQVRQYFFAPSAALPALRFALYGVRYDAEVRALMQRCYRIDYRGWVANYRTPEVYAAAKMSLHIPREQYSTALYGTPTIRVFEVLACGLPLISLPWPDTDRLFTAGADYLVVETPRRMIEAIAWLAHDPTAGGRMGGRVVPDTPPLRTGRRPGPRDHPGPPHLPAPHPTDSGHRGRVTERAVKLTFFGSSLVSSYWNGAATYYRGICKALHARGYAITFVEQDIYERQAHRDLATDPAYASVQVLDVSAGLAPLDAALDAAAASDWVLVCSGIGANDDYIQERALGLRGPRVAFWDVDAPVNLTAALGDRAGAFARRIPAWVCIFTYGGGPRVVEEYTALGARAVHPVYNAVDPGEYYPVPPDPSPEYACDLLLLANRMPDREARIWDLFAGAATLAPAARFVLGGAGWDGATFPPNVRWIGHVATGDHARRNCSARLVLNVNRAAMAEYGYSPPTRIFEAAGNGACLITDRWPGIAAFLAPGREILVADGAADIARYLREVSWAEARAIGARARARVLHDHTYAGRAAEVDRLLRGAGA